MSKVKAGSASKNIHNNAGQRLGVKRFGGQKVNAGAVLVRQTGATKIAGDGVVSFKKVKKQKFTGKTERRTQVRVD